MPRFTVEGAHEHAGHEMKLSIEAPNQDDAIRQARKRGVLVATVQKETPAAAAARLDELVNQSLAPPPLGYAGPSTPAAAPPAPSPTTSVPEYPEIVAGARALHGIATVVGLAGWALFAAGIVGFILGGLLMKPSGLGDPPCLTFILAGIGAVAGAVPLLAAATFLRMNAAIAGAIRDMARNSFQRKAV